MYLPDVLDELIEDAKKCQYISKSSPISSSSKLIEDAKKCQSISKSSPISSSSKLYSPFIVHLSSYIPSSLLSEEDTFHMIDQIVYSTMTFMPNNPHNYHTYEKRLRESKSFLFAVSKPKWPVCGINIPNTRSGFRLQTATEVARNFKPGISCCMSMSSFLKTAPSRLFHVLYVLWKLSLEMKTEAEEPDMDIDKSERKEVSTNLLSSLLEADRTSSSVAYEQKYQQKQQQMNLMDTKKDANVDANVATITSTQNTKLRQKKYLSDSLLDVALRLLLSMRQDISTDCKSVMGNDGLHFQTVKNNNNTEDHHHHKNESTFELSLENYQHFRPSTMYRLGRIISGARDPITGR
jgi:hypothetical protein